MNLIVGEKYLIQNEVYVLEKILRNEYRFKGVSPLAHSGWFLYPDDGLDLVQELNLIKENE